MIATIVNALAIIIGTAIGLLARKGFSGRARDAVYNATGVISLVIGVTMAIRTEHVLAFALAIIAGGLAGTALDIEGAIYRLGEWLRSRFARPAGDRRAAEARSDATGALGSAAGAAKQAAKQATGAAAPAEGAAAAQTTGAPAAAAAETQGFAYGFLNASVLFCVGAMALVGSFKAGTEGDYDLLLTKSVMDGVIAIIFAGAMGIGVGFSALSVLVYQGLLTLASAWVKPYVTAPMINELSAVGGALVMMIGINLLQLKKIRTGDFLPSLVIIVLLSLLFPYVPVL